MERTIVTCQYRIFDSRKFWKGIFLEAIDLEKSDIITLYKLYAVPVRVCSTREGSFILSSFI